jgi:hypothetical protein
MCGKKGLLLPDLQMYVKKMAYLTEANDSVPGLVFLVRVVRWYAVKTNFCFLFSGRNEYCLDEEFKKHYSVSKHVFVKPLFDSVFLRYVHSNFKYECTVVSILTRQVSFLTVRTHTYIYTDREYLSTRIQFVLRSRQALQSQNDSIRCSSICGWKYLSFTK